MHNLTSGEQQIISELRNIAAKWPKNLSLLLIDGVLKVIKNVDGEDRTMAFLTIPSEYEESD